MYLLHSQNGLETSGAQCQRTNRVKESDKSYRALLVLIRNLAVTLVEIGGF